nr:amidohydrolase family protein [Phytohabitans flavus]
MGRRPGVHVAGRTRAGPDPAHVRPRRPGRGGRGSDVIRTVLVEGGRCDTGEAELLLAYAKESMLIAGVVAWADPADPALADVLAGYRALPGGDRLVGIRSQVQAERDPGYLDRADVRRGLRTIAAAGLPFDLVLRADQLTAAARLAGDLPEVRFVLDHLGKPSIGDAAAGFGRWRGPLAALAAHPNVTAKLSGLVTEADWDRWTVGDLAPFVAVAVDAFGADRVMWGSDWPVCLLAASYGRVKEALADALPPLSAAERAAVFGGTAVRTYDLRP